jgi:hypothetical protein
MINPNIIGKIFMTPHPSPNQSIDRIFLDAYDDSQVFNALSLSQLKNLHQHGKLVPLAMSKPEYARTILDNAELDLDSRSRQKLNSYIKGNRMVRHQRESEYSSVD